MRLVSILLFLLTPFVSFSQTEIEPLRLIFPDGEDWKSIEEGETLKLRLNAKGGSDTNLKFDYVADESYNMKMDALGNFRWAVEYNTVIGYSSIKVFEILFIVSNGSMEADSAVVGISVTNKIDKESSSSLMTFEFPEHIGWHLLDEGDTLAFPLSVMKDDEQVPNVSFYLEGDAGTGIKIDSSHFFTWIPSFDFVDRLQQTRDQHVVFIAEDAFGNTQTKKIEFTVFHKNRPPVIKQTPVVYVLQNTNNSFQFSGNNVFDPDGDPLVVVAVSEQLPQGGTLSSKGVFQWKPSRRQFRGLMEEPRKIEFFIEDQPYKARVKGNLMVMASQKDMPPEVTVIPSDTLFEIDEDKFLNINFYLSDANGDDDIHTFNFVSDDIRVPKEALRENNPMQYEFVWQPGYDFVSDPDEFIDISLRFFAVDQSQQSSERNVNVRVRDVLNMDAVDEENYSMYYALLVNVMDDVDHLGENQSQLEKEMNKAKKGKKNRAVMTAGLGAITGLAPLLLEDDPQKVVSAVGGTTVLTLGTLEAKDAVGTSMDEVGEQLKVNVQLKNKLTNEGNAFARRYNTRATRRGSNFVTDIDRLKLVLNDPDFLRLQLDSSWENSNKPTIRRLTKTFNDFKPFDSE